MPNSTRDVSDGVEKNSPVVIPVTSTTPALTSVMVCMAIMAISAVAYFAIRCYYEERRHNRNGVLSCKCAQTVNASDVNRIELGVAPACSVSRQKIAGMNTAIQTMSRGEQLASWTDIRVSKAKRSACVYTSPMPTNDALLCWRPPATGSSRCHVATQRTRRRRYRRRIPAPNMAVPSITINSPSSSDSYSVLTNSRHLNSLSKSVNITKDLTSSMSPSVIDNEEILEALPETSPYHPRYNTPVSETNEDQEHQMSHEGGQDPRDLAASGFKQTTAPSTREAASQSSTSFQLKSQQRLKARRDVKFWNPHSSPTIVIPHFETLPGGKMVTRWTQTDNEAGSLASLDWDHYESERLRCTDQDDAASRSGDNLGRQNSDALMVTHTSDATTTHPSPSSPYVLCYECSDEFSINDDRKLFQRRSSRAFLNTSTPYHHEPLDLRTSVASSSRKCLLKTIKK